LVVEKQSRAIFQVSSILWNKKSSWLASGPLLPVALTMTFPAELVRAKAQSGPIWWTW
jgi:hypothetical protein